MGCILNHCHGDIAMDIVVIGYYATFVAVMIVLSLLSQSRAILTAGFLIALVWLVSILWFFAADMRHYYALALLLDGALAFQFWRMGQREVFPSVLCYLLIGEIIFIVAARAVSLSDFWTIFVLNRIFEAMLLYVIGSAIYRIRTLRAPETHAPEADANRLRFIAG
ncbi:MAG: hypothetical protein CMI63_18425 [Parvularcula sp.]|nr:hypothetical protein [Parvularcula sp.]